MDGLAFEASLISSLAWPVADLARKRRDDWRGRGAE
jgi:hypothetical protein